MQNTGVVRKIDELGRIVIPKEIRRNLGIKDGEEIEIFIEKDAIILKKHYRLLGFKETAGKYLSIFSKLVDVNIIITDREKVILVNKNEFKYLEDLKISSFLSRLIEERKEVNGVNLNIESDKKINGYYFVKPVVVNADLIGSIVCIQDNPLNVQNKLVIDIIDSLLKMKIEAD